METITRTYEALYIVDPTLTEEQVEAIAAKYSQLVADQGGSVQGAGRWDKRRLAYEVKGFREGTYILMVFDAEPAVSKELDRVQRISDDVLRHMISRVEPEHVDLSHIGQPLPEEKAEEPQEAEVETAAEETPAEQAEVAAAEAPAAEEPAAEEPAAEEAQEQPAEAPAEAEQTEEAAQSE